MFESDSILENRYQLQQRLGRTAKGRQTWLATDVETQEQVTVKLLAFSPDMQWEELKLFEREAQVLESLSHPRIPRYRNYFNIDKAEGQGIPWFGLVQDYIKGNSLQDLLDKTTLFTEQKVRQIAIDILEILVYLHGLSPPVLHRDIKPSNLILGEDEKIYLVDFGAVQAQAAVTGVTFTIVGTSGYAPLEQFWGKAVFASDLYALGATLIHLLTGVVPSELPHKDYRIQFADQVEISPQFLNWLQKTTDTLDRRFQRAKTALKVLEYNQSIPSISLIEKPIEALPIPNQTLKRPSNTNIILKNTPDELYCLIPVRGFNNLAIKHLFYSLTQQGGMIALAIFMIGILTFPLSFILVTISWFMPGLLMLLLVPVNFILSIYLFLIIVKGIIGHLGMRYVVELNPKHLFIQNNFLGGLWTKSKMLKLPSIVSIKVKPIDNVAQIMIKTHQKAYIFGYGLSHNEANWIAQNLQQWLNERQLNES
ncbi:MAG: serine/threonine protein kinase [Microcystaceae cyanobacterium]